MGTAPGRGGQALAPRAGANSAMPVKPGSQHVDAEEEAKQIIRNNLYRDLRPLMTLVSKIDIWDPTMRGRADAAW
jgi:hypothetical protein